MRRKWYREKGGCWHFEMQISETHVNRLVLHSYQDPDVARSEKAIGSFGAGLCTRSEKKKGEKGNLLLFLDFMTEVFAFFFRPSPPLCSPRPRTVQIA